MLTTDYKILAKVLDTRVSRVSPTVIDDDQTCCVPGRSIRGNCRLLQDLIDWCEATDHQAALVSLDEEKTFDRVHCPLLHRILVAMNYGPRSSGDTDLLCIPTYGVVSYSTGGYHDVSY